MNSPAFPECFDGTEGPGGGPVPCSPRCDRSSVPDGSRPEFRFILPSNNKPADVEDTVMKDANVGSAFKAEEAFLSSDAAYLYEMREKAERDYVSGMYSAGLEGEERERLRIVKRLLAEGAPVDLICCATGLFPEKAEDIIERLRSQD